MASPVTEEPVDETLVEITLDSSQNESTQNGANGDEVTADKITLSQSIIGPSPDKKKRKKRADVDPDEWRHQILATKRFLSLWKKQLPSGMSFMQTCWRQIKLQTGRKYTAGKKLLRR